MAQLYREGQLYTKESGVKVFDHDWKSLANGVVIPHGLYDLALKIGYVHIGTSHDTSEFAWEVFESMGFSEKAASLMVSSG